MMSDHKVLFIVVIYKMTLRNSETIKSLEACERALNGCTLAIYDNSPSAQEFSREKASFEKHGCKLSYDSTSENLALSTIYNCAIERLLAGEYTHLCLLDQDSRFDSSFVCALRGAIDSHSPELLLPKIFFKGHLVSPTKRFFLKGFYFSKISVGFIGSKYLSAINSGLSISRDFFLATGFRYDSGLRFYGTDDFLMARFKATGFAAYILPVSFEHDLTFSTKNDRISSEFLSAYREMHTAWRILYKKRGWAMRAMVVFYSWAHRVYMFGKYRNRKFLWN